MPRSVIKGGTVVTSTEQMLSDVLIDDVALFVNEPPGVLPPRGWKLE